MFNMILAKVVDRLMLKKWYNVYMRVSNSFQKNLIIFNIFP